MAETQASKIHEKAGEGEKRPETGRNAIVLPPLGQHAVPNVGGLSSLLTGERSGRQHTRDRKRKHSSSKVRAGRQGSSESDAREAREEGDAPEPAEDAITFSSTFGAVLPGMEDAVDGVSSAAPPSSSGGDNRVECCADDGARQGDSKPVDPSGQSGIVDDSGSKASRALSEEDAISTCRTKNVPTQLADGTPSGLVVGSPIAAPSPSTGAKSISGGGRPSSTFLPGAGIARVSGGLRNLFSLGFEAQVSPVPCSPLGAVERGPGQSQEPKTTARRSPLPWRRLKVGMSKEPVADKVLPASSDSPAAVEAGSNADSSRLRGSDGDGVQNGKGMPEEDPRQAGRGKPPAASSSGRIRGLEKGNDGSVANSVDLACRTKDCDGERKDAAGDSGHREHGNTGTPLKVVEDSDGESRDEAGGSDHREHGNAGTPLKVVEDSDGEGKDKAGDRGYREHGYNGTPLKVVEDSDGEERDEAGGSDHCEHVNAGTPLKVVEDSDGEGKDEAGDSGHREHGYNGTPLKVVEDSDGEERDKTGGSGHREHGNTGTPLKVVEDSDGEGQDEAGDSGHHEHDYNGTPLKVVEDSDGEERDKAGGSGHREHGNTGTPLKVVGDSDGEERDKADGSGHREHGNTRTPLKVVEDSDGEGKDKARGSGHREHGDTGTPLKVVEDTDGERKYEAGDSGHREHANTGTPLKVVGDSDGEGKDEPCGSGPRELGNTGTPLKVVEDSDGEGRYEPGGSGHREHGNTNTPLKVVEDNDGEGNNKEGGDDHCVRGNTDTPLEIDFLDESVFTAGDKQDDLGEDVARGVLARNLTLVPHDQWPEILDNEADPEEWALDKSEGDVLAAAKRMGSILVRVVTWNLHGKHTPPAEQLRDALLPPGKFHMYAVGTEECQNSIAKSVIVHSKKEWESLVKETLGASYEMLSGHALQATHNAVFVHRGLISLLRNVRSSAVATGLSLGAPGTTLGNKGGVGISFNIGATSCIFVNCHLAAHQNNIRERNDHFFQISQGLVRALGNAPVAPHAKRSTGDPHVTAPKAQASASPARVTKELGNVESGSGGGGVGSEGELPPVSPERAVRESKSQGRHERPLLNPELSTSSDPLENNHGMTPTVTPPVHPTSHVSEVSSVEVKQKPEWAASAAPTKPAITDSASLCSTLDDIGKTPPVSPDQRAVAPPERPPSPCPSDAESSPNRLRERSRGRKEAGREGGCSKTLPEVFDRVVWAGDLNYRVNVPRAVANVLLSKDMHGVLLKNEQLSLERERGGNTAPFAGYREGPLNFRPTYKFDSGTDTYDSSSKQRVPAWTDRVLFAGGGKRCGDNEAGGAVVAAAEPVDSIAESGGMHLRAYYSLDALRTSDHRPVVADFVMEFDQLEGGDDGGCEGAAVTNQTSSEVCSVM